MKRAAAVIAFVLVLAACGGDSDSTATAPVWNHDPADSALGPAGWGEIDAAFEQCSTGRAQSPVDLTTEELTEVLVELEFDYPETPLTVKNTGHVVEAELPEGSAHTLRVGNDEYRLMQFHLHAPSEHTVDTEHYAAEAHLVHESEDGDLAVVAVLIQPGEPALSLVTEVVESAPDEAGEEVELEDEWSPLELPLLSEEPIPGSPPYFTYPGSLTTPGCDEGVRWIVIQAVHWTEQSTIDRLHELIEGFPEYDGYENNSRPVQPLNGRIIENDVP